MSFFYRKNLSFFQYLFLCLSALAVLLEGIQKSMLEKILRLCKKMSHLLLTSGLMLGILFSTLRNREDI